MGKNNSLAVFKKSNECTNAFKSAYPQKRKCKGKMNCLNDIGGFMFHFQK